METIVSENWSNKSELKDRNLQLFGEFGKLEKVVNDHYLDIPSPSSAMSRNDVNETD
jgi:hypothetical protein